MQKYLNSLDSTCPVALLLDGYRPKGVGYEEVVSIALATPSMASEVAQLTCLSFIS